MDPSTLAVTPALAPPPGVRPDFVNSYSLLPWITATASVCMVLTALVLALRMLTKTVVIRSVDWTDYNALLGFAFYTSFVGCALAINSQRRGRHQWDMSMLTLLETLEVGVLPCAIIATDAAYHSQLENIASIMYCIGIMFAKLSILLLYMKLFVPIRRGGVFWANQVLIYVNGLFYIGAVVALICQCIPRAKISQPRLPGRCTNVYLSFMISGVFNVLSDFFILIFPLWAIWHLQMPLKRKFGVSIVFATGVFALLSSIMRLYYTSQLSYNHDQTFIIAKVALWTTAEVATVLLCGSFPILPRLTQFIKESKKRPRPMTKASNLSCEHHLDGSCCAGTLGSEKSLGTASSEDEHARAVDTSRTLV
ncbi:hypothetical protein EPUS_04471 [Endocarpon pusillum Z07020]|uniref:Rhodopsin domain-containing protein n=1 Tax=Endocarpon pusillum (strain Z07020 / HMAS-L-300199) TaxID=1263415 RepID=U1GX43_ENDPU|nr:uncharacterized protein EPUS_04471 [Endocarpon pusillum Z07020]ERF76651.1 hypothetical protein EPUS_04471 [Endocarpon pusillum Z07020]